MVREDVRDMLSESPFLNDTTIYTTFIRDEEFGVMWGGAVDANGDPIGNGNGRVFFEINDAETDNNWVKVSDKTISSHVGC